MQHLTFDYETFWSQEYTLRRMSPAEYILDPRFEALGCAFKWGAGDSFWVDGPDLPRFFGTIDWPNTYAVSHNALFDACILNWRYGIRPGAVGDTMAMMRNWWSYKTDKVSLSTMAKHMGRPDKMDTVNKFKGMGYDAIRDNPILYQELCAYGPDDCDICYEGFNQMMAEGFPPNQLEIIDRQIRMASEPQLLVNLERLADHYHTVISKKHALLNSIGFDPQETTGLQSNERFALLLRSFGVEPPKKISKTTGQETYAFAKTDEAFTNLEFHPDPMVQAIVAARLGVKSTLEETRTDRYLKIGSLDWQAMPERSMPIPLKYSGAHTHRFSGDWSLNAQNLGRGSELRKAVEAPPGMVVISVDASQIEARLCALQGRWLAIQLGRPYSNLVDQFRDPKADVYANFASVVFGYPVTKASHPTERFIGKTGILSLQYGSSWPVFQNMCRVQSNGQMMPGDAASQLTVETYRKTMPEMPGMWRYCEQHVLPFMATAGPNEWMQIGPIYVAKDLMILPNGNRINYTGLHYVQEKEDGRGAWYYMSGKRVRKIYGPKFVENFTQALAFVIIMEADRRIFQRSDGMLRLAHQVHDELIYVVPEKYAAIIKPLLVEEVSRPPLWMPDAPLSAEAKYGQSYGELIH